MSSRFERVRSETLCEGRIIALRKDVFRHEDGEEVEREVVAHPGAVGIVPFDGERVWLVRQPREAVGVPDLLEIPAGKLDEEGEAPLDTAKRELAEEIGKAAERWEPLGSFYTSPGFSDEEVHLYLATELSDLDERPAVHEDERIDMEAVPIGRLDEAIAEARDSKTLIGLLHLRTRLGEAV
jgi:ADP-ribose pyrophosphatase